MDSVSAAGGRTFSPHDRQPPSEDVCPSSALLGPCWLLGPLVPLSAQPQPHLCCPTKLVRAAEAPGSRD